VKEAMAGTSDESALQSSDLEGLTRRVVKDDEWRALGEGLPSEAQFAPVAARIARHFQQGETRSVRHLEDLGRVGSRISTRLAAHKAHPQGERLRRFVRASHTVCRRHRDAVSDQESRTRCLTEIIQDDPQLPNRIAELAKRAAFSVLLYRLELRNPPANYREGFKRRQMEGNDGAEEHSGKGGTSNAQARSRSVPHAS
jgi:hypothetical protein